EALVVFILPRQNADAFRHKFFQLESFFRRNAKSLDNFKRRFLVISSVPLAFNIVFFDLFSLEAGTLLADKKFVPAFVERAPESRAVAQSFLIVHFLKDIAIAGIAAHPSMRQAASHDAGLFQEMPFLAFAIDPVGAILPVF